jgi:uncharacterized protein
MARSAVRLTHLSPPMTRRVFLVALAATALGAAKLARAQADFTGYYSVPMWAARKDWDHAIALLQQGNSPDTTDETGQTALGYAAQYGSLSMAQTLLYYKAQVDKRDQFGNTPLYWAAERGSTDVMQLLLEAKAAVDPQNKQGVTPLMTAVRHNQLRAVRLLLKYGADPKKADFTGRDSFGWAEGKPAVLQALRGAG